MLKHPIYLLRRLVAVEDCAVLEALTFGDECADPSDFFDDDPGGIAGQGEHSAILRFDMVGVRVVQASDVIAVVKIEA